jgi:excisionase family DNA binding protein
MTDEFLTSDETSRLMKVPTRTLERWRYAGSGPRFLRIGRHVRYRRADIDLWLETQAVEPVT